MWNSSVQLHTVVHSFGFVLLMKAVEHVETDSAQFIAYSWAEGKWSTVIGLEYHTDANTCKWGQLALVQPIRNKSVKRHIPLRPRVSNMDLTTPIRNCCKQKSAASKISAIFRFDCCIIHWRCYKRRACMNVTVFEVTGGLKWGNWLPGDRRGRPVKRTGGEEAACMLLGVVPVDTTCVLSAERSSKHQCHCCWISEPQTAFSMLISYQLNKTRIHTARASLQLHTVHNNNAICSEAWHIHDARPVTLRWPLLGITLP